MNKREEDFVHHILAVSFYNIISPKLDCLSSSLCGGCGRKSSEPLDHFVCQSNRETKLQFVRDIVIRDLLRHGEQGFDNEILKTLATYKLEDIKYSQIVFDRDYRKDEVKSASFYAKLIEVSRGCWDEIIVEDFYKQPKEKIRNFFQTHCIGFDNQTVDDLLRTAYFQRELSKLHKSFGTDWEGFTYLIPDLKNDLNVITNTYCKSFDTTISGTSISIISSNLYTKILKEGFGTKYLPVVLPNLTLLTRTYLEFAKMIDSLLEDDKKRILVYKSYYGACYYLRIYKQVQELLSRVLTPKNISVHNLLQHSTTAVIALGIQKFYFKPSIELELQASRVLSMTHSYDVTHPGHKLFRTDVYYVDLITRHLMEYGLIKPPDNKNAKYRSDFDITVPVNMKQDYDNFYFMYKHNNLWEIVSSITYVYKK